jgi:hypothetical protein
MTTKINLFVCAGGTVTFGTVVDAATYKTTATATS